jgi:hypothetical protein
MLDNLNILYKKMQVQYFSSTRIELFLEKAMILPSYLQEVSRNYIIISTVAKLLQYSATKTV